MSGICVHMFLLKVFKAKQAKNKNLEAVQLFPWCSAYVGLIKKGESRSSLVHFAYNQVPSSYRLNVVVSWLHRVLKWTEEGALSLSFNFGGRPNRLWPMVSWWSLILSISLSAWTAARSDYLTHSSVIPAPDLLQSCMCCADIWVIKHVFCTLSQSYVLNFPVYL